MSWPCHTSRFACRVIARVPVPSPFYLFSRGGSHIVLWTFSKPSQHIFVFAWIWVTHPKVVLGRSCIRLDWNLEMLIFEETGKQENLEKNRSEHSKEPTTNLTHSWPEPVLVSNTSLLGYFNYFFFGDLAKLSRCYSLLILEFCYCLPNFQVISANSRSFKGVMWCNAQYWQQ